jgi:hypothetical protein
MIEIIPPPSSALTFYPYLSQKLKELSLTFNENNCWIFQSYVTQSLEKKNNCFTPLPLILQSREFKQK